jgi:hypothetical protein
MVCRAWYQNRPVKAAFFIKQKVSNPVAFGTFCPERSAYCPIICAVPAYLLIYTIFLHQNVFIEIVHLNVFVKENNHYRKFRIINIFF